ncbi:MAG: UDP-N-acetylmuramate dehydrogenase [Acetobacterales bacterium]
MPASRQDDGLLTRLPKVRGELRAGVPLHRVTWFRVGGPAEVLFRPVDIDDLCDFLRRKPADVPVTLIGVGSNLLIRDGGVRGVVIRLGRGFAGIEISHGKIPQVRAGGVALDLKVALTAMEGSVAGLEFLSGVPGTIGGAVRMNAGAYGRELGDVLVNAEAVDLRGARHLLTPDDLDLTYRHSTLEEGWIVTAATLRGEPGDRFEIAQRIAEIRAEREESQPTRMRTGGSTFTNPAGTRAWQLIDAAGCRGLRRGGALVSEKHCNFLINEGGATAADIEGLGEEVRRRVHAHSGVTLEWEIRRIGEPGERLSTVSGEEAP